jgi:hypothetical protein
LMVAVCNGSTPAAADDAGSTPCLLSGRQTQSLQVKARLRHMVPSV